MASSPEFVAALAVVVVVFLSHLVVGDSFDISLSKVASPVSLKDLVPASLEDI
jgi:hypothetical protein